MKHSRKLVAGMLVIGIVAFAAPAAQAELFFDFSIGAAFTRHADVEVEDPSTFPDTVASEHTDFDPSVSLGFRFGGWLHPVPFFGMAADFSYFAAEGGPVELNNVYPMSLLFLFRAPLLQSQRYPVGRLQPYLGVGPSLFFSDAVVDLRPAVSERVSTTAVDLGLDARAGLAVALHPNVFLFAEYRLTYFEQHLEETTDFALFESLDATADTTLLTHHVLVGVSFRF